MSSQSRPLLTGTATHISRNAALAVAAASTGFLLAAICFRSSSSSSSSKRKQSLGITQILVYPIKSGAAISSEEERLLDSGFERDRRFQITDESGKFVTPRDSLKAYGTTHPSANELFRVRSEFTPERSLKLSREGLHPLSIDLVNAQPTTAEAQILNNGNKTELLLDYGDEASQWLSEATGIKGARLQGIGPKYKRVVRENPKQGQPPPSDNCALNLGDEAPILLTNEASLQDLKRRQRWQFKYKVSQNLSMERFRPNIVVTGCLPWEEDTWKRIRIGSVEFLVWQPTGRCLMTSFDEESLKQDDLLGLLRSFRTRKHTPETAEQANFGMHLIPVAGCPAHIRVDDEIEVLEVDEARLKEWKAKFAPRNKWFRKAAS
mmetsp:Transcript_68299/g.142773  ORF Transcript_68299/g.142773 Transcript_68299/m.142773 type:complete len:378 (+) Transcript_68299:86-1219(+)